ncbi:MAG: aminopeptidase P N-terminal domain-containing protein [Gammaproteobacteria bacterium]|nr:aminopeptidase P N-terminal domain-containing protein [Gammaproteobacteria bacterium]
MKVRKDILNRREILLNSVSKDSVIILFSASQSMRNGDNYYPFRQDSNFYYMTGFDEENAIALLLPDTGEYILFCQEHDPEHAVWLGDFIGTKAAVSDYGADQAYSIEVADELLPSFLKNKKRIYFNAPHGFLPAVRFDLWLNSISGMSRKGVNVPQEFVNVDELLAEMRLIKSESEIDIMRRAAAITAEAQKKTMQSCAPGKYEYELEAELRYHYIRNGGVSVAFDTIVASGANACTLHYNKNNKKLHDGELLLVDTGVEYQMYAADITRTYPVNGRFTDVQKAVYQAVLATQLRVIDAVKPGVRYSELQELAIESTTAELLKLGILHGDLKDLIESKAYEQFYMHNIGHWLGIDSHDVGSYFSEGDWRELKPGMVLTVEPGIYIRESIDGVDPKWWNIGVRIEDDVLVTESGYEILTSAVPKDVDEIERLMVNAEDCETT